MTIVYDNTALGENLRADWGFSCFIQGLKKSILFDTGTDGKILLSNMDKLGKIIEKFMSLNGVQRTQTAVVIPRGLR